MRTRFAAAMTVYAVLAIAAYFLLQGQFRIAVLILLGGFAVKTGIAYAAGWKSQ